MTVDMGRRIFFRDYYLALLDVFLRELFGSAQTRDSSRTDHYFNSFENCYPLLSEAGEMLIEEALNRGINIEGKSRHDIARELFSDRSQMILNE
jgi:hypothetical protein